MIYLLIRRMKCRTKNDAPARVWHRPALAGQLIDRVPAPLSPSPPGPPCCSATASNRRWQLCSVTRTRRQPCSSSGRPVRNLIWSTQVRHLGLHVQARHSVAGTLRPGRARPGWFVTHTGLVRLARRKRCRGIHVEAVDSLCDSAANRFVLKATAYPSKVPPVSSLRRR